MPESEMPSQTHAASVSKALWQTIALACVMAVLSIPAILWGRVGPNSLFSSLVLGCVLLVLVWFDFRSHRLPDMLTLPLIPVGLVATWSEGRSLVLAICGAVMGYSVIWALNQAWKSLRNQHGVGMGDAKLLAGGGAWLGMIALPPILLIASLAGLLMALPSILRTGLKGRAIPFGPALALGIWLIWIWRPDQFLV